MNFESVCLVRVCVSMVILDSMVVVVVTGSILWRGREGWRRVDGEGEEGHTDDFALKVPAGRVRVFDCKGVEYA